jgi:hypothetical protein
MHTTNLLSQEYFRIIPVAVSPFTAAGSSALLTLALFFSMMRDEQENAPTGNVTE